MEMFTKEELAKIAEWTLEDFQNDPLGAMKKVREMAASYQALLEAVDLLEHEAKEVTASQLPGLIYARNIMREAPKLAVPAAKEAS